MTDPLTPDLDDIESKAKAATQGARSANMFIAGKARGDVFVEGHEGVMCDFYGSNKQNDAQLIAALDPTTVLALVAECRELRRLRVAMAYLKQMRVCGSDVMDPGRILAWAEEYGWKEGT